MTLDWCTDVNIGVAFENYGEDAWVGNEGSVAYVTSSKVVFDNGTIKKTKGKLIFVVHSKVSTTLWLSLFFTTSYETLEETDCSVKILYNQSRYPYLQITFKTVRFEVRRV